MSVVGFDKGCAHAQVDGEHTLAARQSGWAMVLAAALLTACASAPKPTEITGTAQAAANVNPSVSKRPSPVLLRIYELKTATAFNSADFISLYQRDQAELGAEMVGRQEIVLDPGASKPLGKMTSPDTRFIGVLAAYRDLDRAQWRSVVAIQPGQKQRVTISAGELSVSASVSK